MSLPFSNVDISRPNEVEDDEDSVVELGQIAILGSSRPSLKLYKSDMNASKRSLSSSRNATNLNNSRLLTSKFGSRTESILGAGVDEAAEKLNEPVSGENALEIVTEPQSGLVQCFDNIKGYIYGIVSALIFVLSQVIMRRSIWLSGPDHVLIRLVLAFSIFYTYLKYNGLDVLGPKKQFKLLVFRGFLGTHFPNILDNLTAKLTCFHFPFKGCIAIATVYCAILFVDPSDVVSLTHTSLIMTAILGKIFLKEKLTIAHFIGILLTAAGVIFITQPPFIFTHKASASQNALNNMTCTHMANESINNVSSCNGTVQELNGRKSGGTTQFGILLTLFAALLVSFTYLVIKKLTMRKVHWATNNIYVSLVGLPICVLASLLFVKFGLAHQNFAQEKKSLPMDLFYSILAGLLANVAQIFLNLALQYEDTTKIAITKTTDVFIAFVLQFLLLDIRPDSMSIVGAFFIILATFFILAFKILSVKYERWVEEQHTSVVTTITDEQQQQQVKVDTSSTLNEQSVKTDLKNKILKKKSIKNFLLKVLFFQI